MNITDRIMREYGISPIPEKITVAMAYVPYQINMGKTYSPQQASEAGTLFEELDKPFLGGAK